MYSTATVERSQGRLEAAHKLSLKRYDIPEVQSRKADLSKLVRSDTQAKDGIQLVRDLTPDERAFVRNEQLLCTIDFRYWLVRYASLLLDQGGLGNFSEPWESQEILLRFISKLEDEMVDRAARGESVDGILIFLHKSRQLGATAIARAISMHSMLSRQHTRAMAASVDEDKVLELYDRDKLILDNLPFYLRPSIGFDEKAQHVFLDKLGSRVIYQLGTQKSGLGQGRQFDVTHLTECASWPYPGIIEHDWMPTIPQSLRAFALLESTAQGRGNWWHQSIQKLQKHRLRRWNLVFIPWYAELKKYRATPPVDWTPSEEAMQHGQRVYETSTQYVGRRVVLSKEQLYWWQSTRDEYYLGNNLAVFYTNYCVAGDTRISTPTGIIPIKAAFNATQVESGKVTNWWCSGEKDVLELRTELGRRLVATPNHSVFLVDGSQVTFERLQPGQKLQLVPPMLSASQVTVSWSPFPSQTCSTIIDEDWGRFLGYFMGDGCYYGKSVIVATSGKDPEVAADVARLMLKITGRHPVYTRRDGPQGGCISLRLTSVHWERMLIEMGVIQHYPEEYRGGWTRNVHVPDIIFRSPKSVVREFLSGLFESDGHSYEYWQRLSLSSSSGPFTRDVQLLLQAFGLNSKITSSLVGAPSSGREKRYQHHLLALGATASESFHNQIGFISARKQKGASAVKKRPGRKRRPNLMEDTVLSVTSAGRELVYDLTVDESHRFGANGILVHNCATIEESFQHRQKSAFSFEALEHYRARVEDGVSYRIDETKVA